MFINLRPKISYEEENDITIKICEVSFTNSGNPEPCFETPFSPKLISIKEYNFICPTKSEH
jgi:hypothetical protein